jgi:diguanylate cyclase (GGDEF)-like protein/PAS domain S-box-containing protein
MPDPGQGLTPESVLDAASEGICVLDETGKVVFANPAAAGLLGWSMDDLIGRSIHDRAMHHRADGHPLTFEQSPVFAVLADGQPRSLEGEVLWRSSNTALLVDYRVTPVFTAGRVTGAVMVFSDARLRPDLDVERGGMFDTGVVGMVVLGLDGIYLQVNSSFCDMLGMEEDELVGSSFRKTTHPADIADCDAKLAELVAGEVPAYRQEKRYLRPDGEVVHVVMHATLVRGGDVPHEPLYFFLQILDVTEQRTADEALRRDAERTARIVELCDLLAEGTHEDRELMTDVAQAVARIVGDAATLWVSEDDGLRAVSNWHPDPQARAILDKLYAEHDGLAEPAVNTGGTTFIADVDVSRIPHQLGETYSAFLDEFPVRSVIVVPLRVRGRTVGALACARNRTSDPYTREDLALVKDIGQRVALAIDNARLIGVALEAQAALSQSEQRHRRLVQQSADVIMIVDGRGEVQYATPSAISVLGRAYDEPGQDLFQHVHPDDMPSVESAFGAAIGGRQTPDNLEFRIRHGDGRWRHVEVSGSNLLDDPAIRGVVVNLRDVTERRRVAEQQAAVAALGQWALSGTALPELLDAAAALVARTLDLPLCGVFELLPGAEELRLVAGVGWAPDAVGVTTAPTGVRGLSEYELAWMPPVTIGDLDSGTRFLAASTLLEQGALSGVSVAIEGHASPYGVLCAFSSVRRTFSQPDVNFLVAVANVAAAVVERRRAEEEVRHQALHDGLTGLPNRTLLADRLEQALAAAQRDASNVGLLLLDLDGFKDVNDSLGHHAGDLLLRQVSERLCAALRGSDTVARLGGDEFAVCLPDLHSPVEASSVAGKLLACLEEPFELAEMAVSLSASIGVAFSGEHGHEPSVLLQRADIAMYRAKRARCGWALYDTATDEAHRHRLAILAELRDAAALGELTLHYQPLINMATNEVEHVEALVRWVHPVRGVISPGEFIPLAEQSGLIHPLTAWVLQEAVDQAARWTAEGIQLPIAVNLSAAVLQDENLPTSITATLAEAGLDHGRLIVEITESVIAEEGVRDALQRLSDAGIACAVDDFGTGYSSLAWLKNLPVQQLKIDREFVTQMEHDARDRAIVASVVTLAHSLGLTVVAEGIETEEVAALLAEMGVDIAQGFLYCHPLPVAELETWLHERTGVLVGSGTIVG